MRKRWDIRALKGGGGGSRIDRWRNLALQSNRVAGTSRPISCVLTANHDAIEPALSPNPRLPNCLAGPASHPLASPTPKAHMAILATHPETGGGEKRK